MVCRLVIGHALPMTYEQTPAPDARPYKRLYRSRENRMLSGLCGGVAEYFNVDPTLVRVILVALTFAGGAGLVAYVVGWAIVPEAPISA